MSESALMAPTTQRYFVSYSGVRLPFNLVTELTEAETQNRNTFFRADYDDSGKLLGFDKVVYGEISMSHRYEYYPSGAIKHAEIINHDEDDTKEMDFPDTAA